MTRALLAIGLAVVLAGCTTTGGANKITLLDVSAAENIGGTLYVSGNAAKAVNWTTDAAGTAIGTLARWLGISTAPAEPSAQAVMDAGAANAPDAPVAGANAPAPVVTPKPAPAASSGTVGGSVPFGTGGTITGGNGAIYDTPAGAPLPPVQ